MSSFRLKVGSLIAKKLFIYCTHANAKAKLPDYHFPTNSQFECFSGFVFFLVSKSMLLKPKEII